MDFKKGMYKISDKDYFAVDALSNSDFRLLKMSPLHYINKELFELDNDSMKIGRAVHKLVLEPNSFDDDFVIEEFEGCDLNKNTKAYKEAKQKWLESVNGREVLSKQDFEKVSAMARNTVAIAGGLLKKGVAETAFFSNFDGIKVKCKVDYYIEELGLIIDIKTAKSIKKRDFELSMLEFNYGTQASFYIDILRSLGLNANRFIFVLVENKPPHNVAIYEVSFNAIEEGRAIYTKYINELKEFLKTGEADVIDIIDYPDWYYNEEVA